MLTNYLAITVRKMIRNRVYTMINVIGVSLGLAVVLLTTLFIQNKLSYDRYLPDADRLYRVIQTGFAETPPGLARALENRYPEFEKLTVLTYPGRYLFKHVAGETFYLTDIISADEHFLEVFRFPILLGNPGTMLARPGGMVITRSLAKRLFGDENPLGQRFIVDMHTEYEVTGVIADIPENTHFHFQAILSFSKKRREERYGSEVKWPFYASYIYALVQPNIDIRALEVKMSAWANENHPYKPKNFGLYLQPLTQIHLHSKLGNEIAPQSDIRYLYFFAALALIVLSLVCINYMNLATASVSSRSKEIGILKVAGARRIQLIFRVLGESILLTLLALPLAMVLVEFAIPWLNRWAGQPILPGLSLDVPTLAILCVIVFGIGLISGIYPAFFLTGFRPADVLRKTSIKMGGGGLLRRILVIVQFAASVALICGTFAIHVQLEFIRNKRLGFEKDYVVTFTSYFVGQRYPTFKQTLLQSPHILALSSGPPPGIGYLNMSTPIRASEGEANIRLGFMSVDYDYLKTLGLELKSGRDFSSKYPSDRENSVILNESATKVLGLSNAPIGKAFIAAGQEWRIIGVVTDFHNRSLKSPVQPIAFTLSPGPNWTGIARLEPENVQAGLENLRHTWEQFVPDRPFEYAFLSDRIARQYRTEQRLAGIFNLFCGLTIFIACLGLFGLAAYTAERRTKEIGIRKVFGATVTDVIALLSKDFTKLVLLADFIAWPVAWYTINRWLQNFAYHSKISWGVFVLAGGLALVIALLTVSTQAMRAALANPVKALRYE